MALAAFALVLLASPQTAPATAVASAEARIAQILGSPLIDAAARIFSSVADSHGSGSLLAQSAKAAVASLDAQLPRGIMDGPDRLLPAHTEDAELHVRDALKLMHPMAVLASTGESPSLKAVVAHVAAFAAHPELLLAQRGGFQDALTAARRLVRPVTLQLRALAPKHVAEAVGSLDFGLLAVMARAIDWPDTSLVASAVLGFPIVGHCPASNVPHFSAVERLAVPAIESMANAAWNAYTARRVQRLFRAGTARHTDVLWSKTIEERDAGLCRGPYLAAQLDAIFGGPDAWRCMERFAVEQERPDGTLKVRLCDNAARSCHNGATSLGETIRCETADFPARAAALFYRELGEGAWSMCLGTDDISNAYRRLGCRTPQFSVVALPDPSSGEARFFVVSGLAFGLKASVNQFNRVPALLIAFARARLGVCCSAYFDDYCTCEPSFARASGQELIVRLHQVLGLPLAPEKHVSMSPSAVFLGVLHDFSRFAEERVVLMRPKPGRMKRVISRLRRALDEGSVPHGEAASLRGKLQFLLSTAMFGGRLVKAALHGLSRAGRLGRASPVVGSLAAALAFIITVLPLLPTRTIRLRTLARALSRPPVVVWSDAMWEDSRRLPGGLGFVVWLPPGHPHLPPHLRPRGRFLHSSRFLSHTRR